MPLPAKEHGPSVSVPSLYKCKDLLRELKNAVHEIEYETFYVSQGLSNTTHHLRVLTKVSDWERDSS